METAVIVLHANGVNCETTIEIAEKPTLPELRRAISPLIGGGTACHVSVLNPQTGGRRDMFYDELAGPKGLPRNDDATAIYRRAYLARFPDVDPEALDWVAGDAVVVKDRSVWSNGE